MNLDKLKDYIHWFRNNITDANFDFGKVRCGTIGCIIGHLPDYDKDVRLARIVTGFHYNDVYYELKDYDRLGAKYFGIPLSDAQRLFTSDSQDSISPKLKSVPGNATVKEVCDVIEQYIKLKGEL